MVEVVVVMVAIIIFISSSSSYSSSVGQEQKDNCSKAKRGERALPISASSGIVWRGRRRNEGRQCKRLKGESGAQGAAPGRLVGVGVGGADGRHHAGGGAGRDVERRPKLAVADAVCEVAGARSCDGLRATLTRGWHENRLGNVASEIGYGGE